MFTVVIATDNDEERLAYTLAALVPAAAEGLVREVVVVDAGSTDETARIADATGCHFVVRPGSAGERLRHGAEIATRGDWLLFLPPGVVPEPRWEAEAGALIERATRAGRADQCAAVFRFAILDLGVRARVREFAVACGAALTGLPHPAQGLIISRAFYRRIGGYQALPALEDVDIHRRIGRFRLVRMRSVATGAARRPGDGALARLRRRTSRLLAALWIPPRYLVRLHG